MPCCCTADAMLVDTADNAAIACEIESISVIDPFVAV